MSKLEGKWPAGVAQALPHVVEEASKRVVNTGFKYFTGRKSYYDVPSTSINIRDFPQVPQPQSVKLPESDIRKMRQFVQDFGDPSATNEGEILFHARQTRQAGTLPISVYAIAPSVSMS